MKTLEIGHNAYVIIGGAFPRCNTIVLCDNSTTVIDPGCSLEDLRGFLLSKNIDLRDIKNVIITHIHPDHIIHAARIQRLGKACIIANRMTAECFDEKEKMKQFLGFSPEHPVRPFWEKLVNTRMYGALDEGKTDIILKDNEAFNIGEYTLIPKFTPGHLPDHMCIKVEELNLLFGGDIDCTDFGPFYGHPRSSIHEFKQSIDRVMNMDLNALISGHLEEPIIKNYKTALKSYLLQFDLREDFVLMAITNGAGTIEEITRNPIIYNSLSDFVYLQFETWMIEHHVDSLLKRELIAKKDGRFIALAA